MKPNRIQVVAIGYLTIFLLIAFRLFYWQILSSDELQALAQDQREVTYTIPASRGEILTTDNYPLVTNRPAYLVFAYTPDIELPTSSIVDQLAPLIADTPVELNATPSAQLRQDLIASQAAALKRALTNNDSSWIPLKRFIDQDEKEAVEALAIKGIGFDEYQVRMYPEGSMSAQLIGFVGSDGTGQPKGYFGLEGYYDTELTGKSGVVSQERDALGRPIVIGEYSSINTRDGRNLKTHIDRSVQLLAEAALRDGIHKYQAKSGEVIIMQPQTGAIIAMAASPSYNPVTYKYHHSDTYRIPAISEAYEPGSIFKPLVMAAAIDQGLVTPETTCDSPCAGPVRIGRHIIRTWNGEYNPGQSMMQVLERSDNTGMVHLGFLLGEEKFLDYLDRFGIGHATGVDLESETVPRLRQNWGDIDLATGTFGQGIAVTSIQMLNAINAIANQGRLMQPQVVDQVISQAETFDIQPQEIGQTISPKTAKIMTQMMVESARHGDAQWAVPEGYRIAGKTGTAQIPIAGHYDPEKTVASFVGFAPAEDPQFTMLVKLREPQTSPWASETAAPLWFDLAQDLFVHLGIRPHTIP